MTSHRLSRRTLLTAAAGAALLSGCAAGRSTVDLAYWNFFTGSDGELMVGLVDEFRREAPGVHVTDTTLMWGSPYYTKLAMACAGGRGPDLATLHASRLATFGRELLDEWDRDELAAEGYFSGSGSTLMSRAGQTLQGVTSRALTPEQGADDLIGWLDGQLTLGTPL